MLSEFLKRRQIQVEFEMSRCMTVYKRRDKEMRRKNKCQEEVKRREPQAYPCLEIRMSVIRTIMRRKYWKLFGE